MSDTVSIDIFYASEKSPKKIFQLLLQNGWQCGYEADNVTFIPAKKSVEDHSDWESEVVDDFFIENFIESHDENDPVRIELRKGDFFGSFVICTEDMFIILGDIVELDVEAEDYRRVVPDFSWYLEQLVFLICYTGSRSYRCSVAS